MSDNKKDRDQISLFHSHFYSSVVAFPKIIAGVAKRTKKPTIFRGPYQRVL